MARLFSAASSQSLNAASAVSAGGTTVNISMACWFYPTTLTGEQDPISIASTGTNYLVLEFRGDLSGQVRTQAFGTGFSGNPLADSTANITTANQWYHIGGTYNFFGSGSGFGTTTSFLSGANKGTSGSTGSTGQPSWNTTSVGSYNAGAGNFCTARIAEAAVWNVILSDAEFAALATGVNPYRVRPSAIIAYWPLYGLSSPEPDLSGFANNMTLSNSPTKANHSPTTLWTPRRPALAVSQTVVVTPSADTLGQSIFRVRQPGWQW